VGTGLDHTAFDAFCDIDSVPNQQMIEARLAIEPHIASLAAERATKRQIASMGEEIVEMSAVVDMPEQYHLHDIRFHRMVAVASGNPVLVALFETVTASRSSDIYLNGDYSIDCAKSAEMHRKIYRSIRSHDPVGARSAMERHLQLSNMALPAAAPEREVDLVATVRDGVGILMGQAV
jgi:GntR family transcriptional repressor for pyruvate dehydrogenase complex